MKGILKATSVVILFCLAGHHVQGEPDYVLPGGPPPTSTTIVLAQSGKPLQPPTILHPVSSSRSQRPHSVEKYISSGFNSFDGGHRFSTSSSKHPYYILSQYSHPNDIPRGPPSKPFEVVRAPVIYHQTVTDTDVTKALADAFDVVEKLRKPGSKPKALPQENTLTNIEYVNHLPQNPGKTAIATTTIVEAPQQINVVQPSPYHHHHRSQAVTLGQVTIVSTPDQQQIQHLPPIPSAADVAPPAYPGSNTVYATSAPVVSTAEVVPVLPATTTSTSPAPAAPPKLIIPSQQHVTTLAEAVQSMDPQVRTIIQPVYIPYPVDQNGRAIGPLPDYHSMDFGLLLSAQKQYLAASSTPTRDSAPIQIVQTQPAVIDNLQQQPQNQEYFVQTDQSVAAADVSSGNAPSTLPTRTRKRIARRRNNYARRI